jgi:hypothetical protein
LLEGAVYLGLPPLVFGKCGFDYFAVFCAHVILPNGDGTTTRHAR